MEESNAMPNSLERPSKTGGRLILFGSLILLLVLLAGFLAYRAWNARQGNGAPAFAEHLSAKDLEARYGLRVRLLGVTAGGGMVDFRLKIVDPDKARQFLQDPANLPKLMVAEGGEVPLRAEALGDDVKWEEGGILFMLLPNRGGAIKPGTPVIVEFGSVQMEPILAQ